MPICELCGRESPVFNTTIEGAELLICKNCGGRGTSFERKNETMRTYRQPIMRQKKVETGEHIIVNYANIIRNRRKKLDLKQEDFARQLNVKESILNKLEAGSFTPSIRLARRIGRTLNINLIEQREVNGKSMPQYKKLSEATLGDIVKIRKRKG